MEKLGFSAKLIEVRKAKGLTQEEVAKQCKITVRTIQRIEAGMVNPRAFTIKIISDTLGFDFFATENAFHDVTPEDQNLKLESHTVYRYIEDLFNFKTNAMKKISILTSGALLVLIGLFAVNSKIIAQNEVLGTDDSVIVFYNDDESVRRIEVRFSNSLTYDNLVSIKALLESYDIGLNYKRIVFDKNDRLSEIACVAFSDVGIGSFNMPLWDTRKAGFFCDFSPDANPAFCIGFCDL